MPDQPNYQEFGTPVVGSEVDATDVFDARYGKYTEQKTPASPTAKPFNVDPFTLTKK